MTRIQYGYGSNPFLTDKENEVLRLVCTSKSNKEIAEELNISYHTFRTHLSNIYSKLHVHSIKELIMYVQEHNLINHGT